MARPETEVAQTRRHAVRPRQRKNAGGILQIESIVQPQRAKRRFYAQAKARSVTEFGKRHFLQVEEDIAGVVEDRKMEAGQQRNPDFAVCNQECIPAHWPIDYRIRVDRIWL